MGGAAWSAFLIRGLPSCYGGSWPMLVACKAGDHKHLAAAAAREPLLLLASSMRGFSLVHLAAERGAADTLRVLIRLIRSHAPALSARLAALAANSQHGGSDLAATLARTSSCAARLLLEPEHVLATLLSWQAKGGLTPLMVAARNGHAGCVELLLEHGADPLAVDGVNRRSCLHYAVCCGHARCVHALLNALHVVWQPAAAASQDGGAGGGAAQQQELVLLQDAQVKDGHSGMTSFVDLRTRTGLSALHYAAFWGFMGCVRALLMGGASVSRPLVTSSRHQCELPVLSGNTALHLAAEAGNLPLAALLLHAHVEQMQAALRRAPHPLAQQGGGAAATERLFWEGSAAYDPRCVRNSSGDTPHSLALFHRGPKELLMLMLDPTVPLAWVLPQGLERCFGATPRLGVQPLAAIAKRTLDEHLQHSLDLLDQLEQQQQQQQACQHRSMRAKAGKQQQDKEEQDDQDEEEEEADGMVALCGSVDASVSLLPGARMQRAATRAAAAGTASAAAAAPRPQANGGSSSSRASSAAASYRSASCGSIISLASSSSSSGHMPIPASSSYGSIVSSEAPPPPRAAGCGAAAGADACASSDGADDDDDNDDDDDDGCCAICFEQRPSVMLSCSHCLCGGCARSLLRASCTTKPALCPWCRSSLGGFTAAPADHTT